MHTRPADAADENETAGQESYSETFHTFTSMNKELERYIEREIIPRYEDFDAAHRTDHVRTVIAQSLELAAHYDADADMVYTVAAYHDTGLANGRERHHIDAGRILAADTELRRWFSEEQIAVMRDAVEDHRASSDGEPRTIYGRIVAEADRVIDPETIIRRTVQYGLAHCPELDREEQYARCLAHLQQKYAEGRLPAALDRRVGKRPAARRTARRDPRPATAAEDVRRGVRHGDRGVNPGRPRNTGQENLLQRPRRTAPCKTTRSRTSPPPDRPAKNPGRLLPASGICVRNDAESTRYRAGNISCTARAGRNRPPRSRNPCVRGIRRATRNPGGRPTRR